MQNVKAMRWIHLDPGSMGFDTELAGLAGSNWSTIKTVHD